MRKCGGTRIFPRGCLPFATLVLVACARAPQAPVDGVVVFDEDVQLVRGAQRDAARREVPVGAAGTFVAFVYEDDCDVTLRLESTAPAAAPRSVAVNSLLYGEGLEVAALDATPGAPLVLLLDAPPDADAPCHSRMKVLRYDAGLASQPRVAARLAAFRAWTAATSAVRLQNDRDVRVQRMDEALRHLDSADGDNELAAWARAIRASINTEFLIDHRLAAREARVVVKNFVELGDARNAGRSRYRLSEMLVEIEMDKTGVDPTAEEASREAVSLLQAVQVDPALSRRERARARSVFAIHEVHMGQWREAESNWQVALTDFRGSGDRQGELQTLQNLGVLAGEVGEFELATRYFDQVVPKLHISTPENRVLYLNNAARADISAGRIDRAIERLLLSLQWNRELHQPQLDARILHALGRAYWARGDTAQATAFFNEALRLRRTVADQGGLLASLRYAGMVARQTGDVAAALRMHQEALKLAVSDEARLRGMLDVALDHAAIPDYPKAIRTCRDALALPAKNPDFYKRHEAKLALGEFLLSQPAPGASAIAEAASLAAAPLDAALRRNDIAMELTARHLLARTLVARRQWQPAREEYERAVGLIFKYSSASTNPELQATTLMHEQATIRDFLDLLMRDARARGQAELRPASVPETDALRMLEWARATGFTNSRGAALDPASATRVDALLAQMAAKRVRVAELLDRAGDASRDVDRLQLEIAQLRAEVDRIRSQAGSSGPGGSTSFLGAPALPALQSGTTQWSYAFGNDAAYLWVRDQSGTRAAVLALTPQEISRQVGLLKAATHGQEAEKVNEILQSVAQSLVPAGAIREPQTALEIVAEGNLAGVPFAGLRPSGADAITMVTSLFHPVEPPALHARLLRFAGVATNAAGMRSVGERVFPPLGSTVAETRSVAAMFETTAADPRVKLLSGQTGSSAALESVWRGGVDVLHVATHGLADLRQPMTSLILLPAVDDAGGATYLTAGQVQEWRGDADLVYLGACETAVGPVRFAQSMPGLQRAFLRAGARGVIATLWPIEDVYASQFATQFYKRYTAGMPAAQALAETQRAWLTPLPGISPGEQAHRRLSAWAHVYYRR